ncbi:hypothetical protein Ferp_2465 [Ferroglobus placidus DSM 10642]|uniref:Uncharacterized protein n=1 Tax=Ferroglobus placidus (strain DSM 10642 / AEDII12DO) TaxID=589924 RepID=D3S282_FERPA|nr:hypothetical protein [Ferroglobus placidus]ADC66573.1 hypothetical protein Ferp_2465 [Ferroglobus placidus DSM 10642]
MVEIVIKMPEEIDEKLLAEIQEEIRRIVKLRLARELLLKEWDERFSRSELSDEECLELGKEVNRAALKIWKEKGWL